MALILLLSVRPAFGQRAVLKAGATPIYETPFEGSRRIAVLAAGDTVEILKIQKGWVQLAFGKNRQGWMSTTVRRDRKRQTKAPVGISLPRSSRGGISFHLGSFSSDFSYVGRFYYQSTPKIHMEGSFQYAAGKVTSLYLMHLNFRRVWPMGREHEGWLTAGAGVVTSVPIKSAGSKSVSNMALNYGFGVRKKLKHNNWLRFDLRRFTVFASQGVRHFVSWTVGIEIGIPRKERQ